MRGRVVNVRVSEAGLAAFDEVCKTRGVRRSEGWREAMSAWMRPPSGMGGKTTGSSSALSRSDVEELRCWRLFAERTAVNGDPARQITPDVEMHGWTFVVLPQRDENLEIA